MNGQVFIQSSLKNVTNAFLGPDTLPFYRVKVLVVKYTVKVCSFLLFLEGKHKRQLERNLSS